MLSKLGSAHKKPNGQTIIRHRAVRNFLSGFKFTKIRNLGGKLGDQIVQKFGTESVSDLVAIPIEQFKSKLGDDTGVWVYNTVRGVDNSEINSRVQIKSMLSAKSFRPSINNVECAVKWLRIFVNDIFSRLVEEGVLENKRRPRTINLSHRLSGVVRSRRVPIPQGKPLDKDLLLDLAKNLLNHIVMEGKVWPCSNLSLSVGGFDEGISGNMGIGAFLVTGEEAQSLKRSSREGSSDDPLSRPPEKHRKVKREGIQRFFSRTTDDDDDRPAPSANHGRTSGSETFHKTGLRGPMSGWGPANAAAQEEASVMDEKLQEQNVFLCRRCEISLEDADKFQYHQDEHLARDLQEEERGSRAFASHATSAGNGKGTAASAKRSRKSDKTEAGQSKLNFG